MTRIGINPARGKLSTHEPSNLTLAVLTHIPNLDGYFQHRLEVLRVVLSSLIAHTTIPHDLLVFDNGSCTQVLDYLRSLRDSQQIDYLVLSRENLGKIDALKVLFNAAPGEIVAYSDDDILFYPGWLEAHMKILETYPNVGMVSGAPVRDAAERARKALIKWIEDAPPDLSFSYEHRIPDDWEADWAVSTGRDPQDYLRSSQKEQDLILKFKGLEAFGSASHFQFVSPKKVVQSALPEDWSGMLMGQMMELDEAIDEMGYLRLCTVDRYTRHLGNALSPVVVREVRSMGIISQIEDVDISPPERHWILRIPGSRRVLRVIYNRLFEILNR